MNALTITAEKRHAPPVTAETWGRAPVQRIALIVGRSLDFNSANDRNATVDSRILSGAPLRAKKK
jgi:hypothetical protein